jgi:putative membrane protein
MPTNRLQPHVLAVLLGLLGTTFLFHSLTVHPQDMDDKPSATQSQEGSPGASAGATSKEASGVSAGKITDRDQGMMKQMAESHLGEISLGKLAQEKAQSDEVKSFAKKMVDDHTKALDSLKQLAESKGVTLPTEPDKQQMAMQKKLEGLSAQKFDRQYIQQARDRAHRETHKLLQRAASRAEDTDLKNYASTTLGAVETHMQMAKETTENLKASSEGKSSGEKSGSGAGQGSSGGAKPGDPSSEDSGASSGGASSGSK